jgi:hypothetical protein
LPRSLKRAVSAPGYAVINEVADIDIPRWRWVFLINEPVGLLAFGGCYALLRDPD